MVDVHFVDEVPGDPPPNSRQHRQRMETFVAALKKRPGEWAIYPYPGTDSSARASASRISCGKIAAFGKGFDAVCRGGTVYVRYLGEQR